MKTQELKQFVLQQFELGTEFETPAKWAAYLRSVFPSANDDEIITALCEIIDGYEPNRSRGNPKIVKSIFGTDGTMDFTAPNHKALSQMDSFLQNHDRVSNNWDRQISRLFVNDGGKGWEGVMKNDYGAFMRAWNLAMEFCEDLVQHEEGTTWHSIANA